MSDWPEQRRCMCTECGDVLAFFGTHRQTMSHARDHVLDVHRDHADPGSIVFVDCHGPRR